MDRVRASVALIAVALMFGAACKNKDKGGPILPPVPASGGPASPAASTDGGPRLGQRAPTIDSFTAEPARVSRGESITLRWSTNGADTVTLDQGIGSVAASGSRQLFPTGTTTYVLIARNTVGTDTRSVTVDVTSAPTPTSATSSGGPSAPGEGELISQLQTVYFDLDMSELREDARRAVNTDADILKRLFALNGNLTFVIEGHCDERGSAEYNLGLGDRRAVITRDALVQLGVPAAKLRTVSFGKEAPVCRESTEDCWQKNRRAAFTKAQ
jgi:peptidoglycan-associated lipoprotein